LRNSTLFLLQYSRPTQARVSPNSLAWYRRI